MISLFDVRDDNLILISGNLLKSGSEGESVEAAVESTGEAEGRSEAEVAEVAPAVSGLGGGVCLLAGAPAHLASSGLGSLDLGDSELGQLELRELELGSLNLGSLGVLRPPWRERR